MARVSPVYPAFSRGEISPLMFGRTDIDVYSACLDKCRNCWVRPYGVVSRVSGTEFVHAGMGPARLMKFVFNAQDSYIIECGAGAFRFYRNGCVVTDSSGQVYQVANPFTQAQLKTIQYVQLDDVIKIVYENDSGKTNKPLELIRYASNNWVLREVSFKSSPFLDINTTTTTLSSNGTSGTIVVTASTDLFQSGHKGSFWKFNGGIVKVRSVSDARNVIADCVTNLTSQSVTVDWYEGAWSSIQGYPSKIAIFEGRLYYARTPTHPRNVYGSHPYAYEDFSPAENNEDSGAINIELAASASGDGSAIQWLNGSNVLVVGTYGSEFIIRGGDSGIVPSNVSANAKTNWGSESIQPPTLGSLVYFVQRSGKKIRQFAYDFTLDTYIAVDVSLYSEHLLDSPIQYVAYQKAPDSVLYCVRNDGKVAVLTLELDQQVQAWALLDFGGTVESVETIPSYDGNYDEVYFLIKRIINNTAVRHIERITNPITDDDKMSCWYVRDGLKMNNFDATIGYTLSVSGRILMTNRAFFTSDMGAVQIGDEIYTITQVISSTMIEVDQEPPQSAVAGGEWAVASSTISGFDHLIGETVQVIADGEIQIDKVVSADGEIELDEPAFEVVAGLGYESYMKTMPLEAGSQNGSSVGKRKRINEVSLRVWKTAGGKIGSSLDQLIDIPYKDATGSLGTTGALFTGVIPNIKYNQGWTYEANITVQQDRPLPLNVLAICPIINEVDK